MRKNKHHSSFPGSMPGVPSGMAGLRKPVCFIPDKWEKINETFMASENQKILLNSNQVFIQFIDARSKRIFLSTISQN